MLRLSRRIVMPVAQPLERRTLLAAVTWDGGGDGVNWSDANNWSTNTLPGLADDVTIDVATNPTIRLSNSLNALINSLTCAEAFEISNFGLLFVKAASSVNGHVTITANGSIQGAGDVTFNGGLTWNGGFMAQGGRTILAAGTVNSFATNSAKSLNRTIQNLGTINYTGNNFTYGVGTLDLTVAIENAAGATFNITNDGDFVRNLPGTLSFINAGVFNKSGTTGETLIDRIRFVNSGIVNVESGTLGLSEGSSTATINVLAAGTLRLRETFIYPSSGTALSGEGAITFEAGTHDFGASQFLPTGTVHFSGGTVTINNSFTPAALGVITGTVSFNANQTFAVPVTLAGGTLSGTGDVTISGGLAWNSGNMTGTGLTILAADTANTIATTSTKGLDRNLRNLGVLNYTGVNLKYGITFNGLRVDLENAAGATFNVTADGDLNRHNLGNSFTFTNAGTFNKITTIGETTFIDVRFNNTGSVNLNAGILSFNTAGSTTTTYSIASGSTLNLSAGHDFNVPAGGLAGAGNVNFRNNTFTFTNNFAVTGALAINGGATLVLNAPITLGTVTLAGGDLSGTGDVTITGGLNWNSGIMAGTGRTILAAETTSTIATTDFKGLERGLRNLGTINYTGSSLSFGVSTAGQTIDLENAAGATFNVTADGDVNRNVTSPNYTFTNAGTFNKNATAGLTTFISVRFINIGTVNINAGTLRLNGGANVGTGAFLSSGRYVVGNGTTLDFVTPTTTLTADIEIDGSGSVPSLVGLRTNRGRVGLTGGADVVLTSGNYVQEGILDLSPTTVFTVNGNASFAGVSQPVVRTNIASATDFGRVIINGSLNLNSPDSTSRFDANLVGAYDPAIGTRHVVITTAGGITNAFDGFQGGATPSNNILLLNRPDENSVAVEVGPGPLPPPPQVVAQSFELETHQAINLTFNQNVSSFLARKDYTLQNLTTGALIPHAAGRLTYNQTSNVATLLLTNELPDGNYTLTINASDIANHAGVPASGAPIVFNFFVLAGDANRDRVVNFDDLLILAQNYGQTGRSFTQGNFNYSADGLVDFDDLLILAQRYGTSLVVALIAVAKKRSAAMDVIA